MLSSVCGEVPQPVVPRYKAPIVTVTRVTEASPSEPVVGAAELDRSQQVLLSVGNGGLRFYERRSLSGNVPRDVSRGWKPEVLVVRNGSRMRPKVLGWVVEPGAPERPHLGVEDANALLAQIAPYAQALVDGLVDVDGEVDWSAAAMRAGRHIERICLQGSEPEGPEADGDLVDYGEIVQRFPEAYDPGLLMVSSDELAQACREHALGLATRVPPLMKEFGKPIMHGRRPSVKLEVLGVRAWYRAVRLEELGAAIDFEMWAVLEEKRLAGVITEDSTDDQLKAWADAEVAYAATHGVRLVGAAEGAVARRDELLEQSWERYGEVGTAVASMPALRNERDKLMRAWHRRGKSYPELAEQGGVTQQRVGQVVGEQPWRRGPGGVGGQTKTRRDQKTDD